MRSCQHTRRVRRALSGSSTVPSFANSNNSRTPKQGPLPQPPPPATLPSPATKLLATIDRGGAGLRARLLGSEGHAALGRSLPMRLRHLRVLANSAAATIGWLPVHPQMDAAGDSIVGRAEALLEELAAAARGATERVLRRRKLVSQMLLVLHNDNAVHTVDIEPGALPEVDGLALVYCLRLGVAKASSNATLQLMMRQDEEGDRSGASSLSPPAALAPDALGLIVCAGRPSALRLAGPFTALVLFVSPS